MLAQCKHAELPVGYHELLLTGSITIFVVHCQVPAILNQSYQDFVVKIREEKVVGLLTKELIKAGILYKTIPLTVDITDGWIPSVKYQS